MSSTTSSVSPATFSSFGALLRYLRLRARLSQRDLAIAVGYSEAHISRLEQNQRHPDIDMLLALFIPALDMHGEQMLAERLLELARAARAERGVRLPPEQPADHEPPPRPPAERLGNLPTPPNALVGRDQEVAVLCTLLRRPDVRLVVLTGLGGIGKTRLALAAVSALQSEFMHGSAFVGLASVSDPALLLDSIAAALAIPLRGDQPPQAAIKAFLRDKQLLLLVDNFEQVLPVAPLLSELLASASQLKLLVTSRVALRLYGEREIVVGPLPIPPETVGASEQLARYAAVRLFADRAQAARADFVLNEANIRIIAAICARLDGIPLALELAAARLRLLTPRVLFERLQNQLAELTGGARDLPTRQRTLRAALAWSYDLLEPQEQQLFTQLGVFAGGWTIEAATTLFEADTLDLLASLLDKSLIRQSEGSDGEPRFSMLEMLRAYALEQLAAAGAEVASRQRFARYMVSLAERVERELGGPSQQEWLQRLEAEQANLRAALTWMLEAHELETALQLTAALWKYWRLRSHQGEGDRWLRAVLNATGHVQNAMRAQSLYGAGWIAHDRGDYTRAGEYFAESLALLRVLKDARGIAEVLHGVGEVAKQRGDYAGAKRLFEESLALYQSLGDQEGCAWTLDHLGLVEYDLQHTNEALTLLREGLERFRTLGHSWGIAISLLHLGLATLQQEDYPRATQIFEESLVRYRQLGNRLHSAWPLLHLGRALLGLGNVGRALPLLEESLALFMELGNKRHAASALHWLGRAALLQRNAEQATLLGEVSLALFLELGDARADLARQLLADAREA